MPINARSDTLNRNGRFAPNGLSVSPRKSAYLESLLSLNLSIATTNTVHDFICSTNLRTSFFFAVTSESTIQSYHHLALELVCANRCIHASSTIVAHYRSFSPPPRLLACRKCSFQSLSPHAPRSSASQLSISPTSSHSPRSKSQLTATTFSSLLRSRTEQF